MAEAVDTCHYLCIRCDDIYAIWSHCLCKLVLQRLYGF